MVTLRHTFALYYIYSLVHPLRERARSSLLLNNERRLGTSQVLCRQYEFFL